MLALLVLIVANVTLLPLLCRFLLLVLLLGLWSLLSLLSYLSSSASHWLRYSERRYARRHAAECGFREGGSAGGLCCSGLGCSSSRGGADKDLFRSSTGSCASSRVGLWLPFCGLGCQFKFPPRVRELHRKGAYDSITLRFMV